MERNTASLLTKCIDTPAGKARQTAAYCFWLHINYIGTRTNLHAETGVKKEKKPPKDWYLVSGIWAGSNDIYESPPFYSLL